MSDNVFSTALFVLIAAVAVAATVEIVDNEIALRRAVAVRAAGVDAGTPPAAEPPAPEAVAIPESGIIYLPTVTVTGHRPLPQREAISSRASPAKAF